MTIKPLGDRVVVKMAEVDKRIRVFHKENGGLSSARNYGLEQATGEYICFVDSDDWIADNYCQCLMEGCMMYQTDLAMCKFERVTDTIEKEDENGDIRIVSGDEVLRYLDDRQTEEYVRTVIACNKLYHRKLFEKVRYPQGKIHEDEFIIAEILLQVAKVAVVEKTLYYYFQRDNSITGASKRAYDNHMDLLDAYQHIREVFERKERTDLALISWRNYMLTLIEWMYAEVNEDRKIKRHFLYDLFCAEYRKRYRTLPLKYLLKYGLFIIFPGAYKQIFKVRIL